MEIDQLDRIDPDDVFFRTETYLIISRSLLDYGDAKFIEVSEHIKELRRAVWQRFLESQPRISAYIIDSFRLVLITKSQNVDAQWYSSIFLHWVPGEKIRMGQFGISIWLAMSLCGRDLSRGVVGQVEWLDQPIARGPAFVERVKDRYADFDSQPGNQTEYSGVGRGIESFPGRKRSHLATIGRYVWPNPVVYDIKEEVAHLEDWLDTRMDWMKEALERL